MSVTHLNIIKAFILPPGILITLTALGILLWLISKYKLGLFLICLATLYLYLLSIPFTTTRIIKPLQQRYQSLDKSMLLAADAIVILSGGRNLAAPDYNQEYVNSETLVRITYGLNLARQLNLPIIVSGGSPYDEERSEAMLMHDAIVNLFDYKQTDIILESKSKNTRESAAEIKNIMQQRNFKQVILVTQAWHMLRSEYSMQINEVAYIPAPTDFYVSYPNKPEYFKWLPNAGCLAINRNALHEYIGLIWYRLS